MGFKTKNLSYAFYVEYYDKFSSGGQTDAGRVNNEFISIRSEKADMYCCEAYSFKLQTRYPGLLIGIGNEHPAVEEGQIALGFAFDYVTGTPYIPGSSVKGILRSAFRHKEYIRALLGDDSIDAEALENEIFEGTVGGKELPMHSRDVFYDSFPVTEGRLMDMEAITSHGNDVTKNPNPVTLVKVKPNVTFVFSFKLRDGSISAEKKLAMFKEIITDLGAGAKTNTGYGVFSDTIEEFHDRKPHVMPEKKQGGAANKPKASGGGAANKPKNPGMNNKRGAASDDDRKRTCRQCKKTFIATQRDIEFEAEKGWRSSLCADCRRLNWEKRKKQ